MLTCCHRHQSERYNLRRSQFLTTNLNQTNENTHNINVHVTKLLKSIEEMATLTRPHHIRSLSGTMKVLSDSNCKKNVIPLNSLSKMFKPLLDTCDCFSIIVSTNQLFWKRREKHNLLVKFSYEK